MRTQLRRRPVDSVQRLLRQSACENARRAASSSRGRPCRRCPRFQRDADSTDGAAANALGCFPISEQSSPPPVWRIFDLGPGQTPFAAVSWFSSCVRYWRPPAIRHCAGTDAVLRGWFRTRLSRALRTSASRCCAVNGCAHPHIQVQPQPSALSAFAGGRLQQIAARISRPAQFVAYGEWRRLIEPMPAATFKPRLSETLSGCNAKD
jgi:hypothetical protein